MTDSEPGQGSQASWHVHHVHKQLPLKLVALGGDNDSYIITYKDGNIAWGGGLPNTLYDTLDKVVNKENGEIAFAAIGRICGSATYKQPAGDEVWFLRDADSITWLGEDSEQTLSNVWWGGTQDHTVERVYFAPSNGWFVLKEGGGARWDNLPDSLQDALDKNWDEGDGVVSLSVGHNGEWFVKYRRGWSEWCGLHPVLDHWLQHKTELTGSVKWVELGPNGSFVALFQKYTLWYGSQDLTDALLP